MDGPLGRFFCMAVDNDVFLNEYDRGMVPDIHAHNRSIFHHKFLDKNVGVNLVLNQETSFYQRLDEKDRQDR